MKQANNLISYDTYSMALNRENYFDYLIQTKSLVVESFAKLNFEHFSPYSKNLIKKRFSKSMLRPTLTRIIYEILTQKKFPKKFAPLLVAIELQTIYLYINNIILDNKNDVRSNPNTIKALMLDAMLLREMYENLVRDLNISIHKKTRILNLISKNCETVVKGQQLEISTALVNFFDQKEDAFIEWYKNKCLLLSGDAYGICGRIGVVVGSISEKIEDNAYILCSLFGTGLHISNDLGDWAVCDDPLNSRQMETFSKTYQDQLNDFIEVRPTYAVFLITQNNTRLLDKKDQRIALLNNFGFLELIKNTNMINKNKKIIKHFYLEAKKQLKTEFPKTKQRDILSTMLSVIRSNKYLHYISKI